MVETLTALLTDVDQLPQVALPAAQEAAMAQRGNRYKTNTVPTGEKQLCGGPWTATMASGTKLLRDARPAMNKKAWIRGESHRRRRLLGIHAKGHF